MLGFGPYETSCRRKYRTSEKRKHCASRDYPRRNQVKRMTKEAVRANWKALKAVCKAKDPVEKQELAKVKEVVQDKAHRLMFGGQV